MARLKKDERSDQLADVTLVIPTHNRHSRLARALSYYGGWNTRILVLDSTNVPYQQALGTNVTYLHVPQVAYAAKFNQAMSLVETPYVLFSADDDFVSVKGVLRALAYMRKNPRCASAQGWHAGYVVKNRQLFWNAMHVFAKNYRVIGDGASERLEQQSSLYMSNFYALQLTSVAKDCFCRVVPSLPQDVLGRRPDLVEMAQAFCSVVWGDHVILPMLWIGREGMAESLGSSIPQDEDSQRNDFQTVLANLEENLKEHFDSTDACKCFQDAGLRMKRYGKSWYAGEIPNFGPIREFMMKSSDLGSLALMDNCIRKHLALYD